MLEIVKYQKEEKITEKEKCFSATEMITWEKNKWKIYRSITCKYKQPDICKSIF